MQKRKRKSEKNDAKIREKKEKKWKSQASIKRSKVCLCQEKLIYFRSEHSNTWGVLNFRAKGINFGGGRVGGCLKKKWNFPWKFLELSFYSKLSMWWVSYHYKLATVIVKTPTHGLLFCHSVHLIIIAEAFPIVIVTLNMNEWWNDGLGGKA